MTTAPDGGAVDEGCLTVSYIGASDLTVLEATWRGTLMPARVRCAIEGLEEMDALLDTGSQYCILPPAVARELLLDPSAEPRESFQRGPDRRYEGAVHMARVRIRALAGQDLEADPAWVVPPDWEGPPVLGWRGFLATLNSFGCRPGCAAGDAQLFFFLPGDTEAAV
jgi:predicted aspartyl protease